MLKIEEIERKKINDKKKEEEFSEKIDELNQETDTLLRKSINGKRKYQIQWKRIFVIL